MKIIAIGNSKYVPPNRWHIPIRKIHSHKMKVDYASSYQGRNLKPFLKVLRLESKGIYQKDQQEKMEEIKETVSEL